MYSMMIASLMFSHHHKFCCGNFTAPHMMWRIEIISALHVIMHILGSVANRVEHLISSHPRLAYHLILASLDF